MPQHIKLSELVYLIEDTLYEKFDNKLFWIVAETSDIRNYYQKGWCFLKLLEKDSPPLTPSPPKSPQRGDFPTPLPKGKWDSKSDGKVPPSGRTMSSGHRASIAGGRGAGRGAVIAQIEAVIWRQNYHIIGNFESVTGRKFEKNIEVLLKVRVTFSAKYGRLNLEILEIDHSYTLGKIELEKQEILDKLVKDNPKTVSCVDGEYFTFNKKLQLPIVIQKIALISAPNSDGYNDFVHELTANRNGYKFFIDDYLTQIQGQNADQLIIGQLEKIIGSTIKYDVVVIVRGGGSQLDFRSFDTYNIGKTIAGYTIPVITGIGHERNVSIADLMSNLSVKTPTKAAAEIIAHNQLFEEQIIGLKTRLFESTADRLIKNRDALNEITLQFKSTTKNFLTLSKYKLDNFVTIVRHLNPNNVLARGYAVVLFKNKILTNPDLLKLGSDMKTILKNSIIESRITKKILATKAQRHKETQR
ncbi:MAG: exodeoxyribonuclease VII large subunit [Cytophagales bacterium]|nr:exodeoxyribonuclease VII large subunit [Cytophagales bacterium]